MHEQFHKQEMIFYVVIEYIIKVLLEKCYMFPK